MTDGPESFHHVISKRLLSASLGVPPMRGSALKPVNFRN
jgi:hypothetical protein